MINALYMYSIRCMVDARLTDSTDSRNIIKTYSSHVGRIDHLTESYELGNAMHP